MSTVRFDLHTHTTYSDGWDWREMATMAADRGLEGIGFTDHCPIVEDAFGRKAEYDFADTYHERRSEFDAERQDHDLHILDGAEVNYDPDAEAEIAAFLETAEFDYTIGSVHVTDSVNITAPTLSEADLATRREAIDTYVDWQVSLIESELFDVIGHVDVSQRTDDLHDVMTAADHERLAEALANHPIVPELNAGRLDRSLATIHPDPAFLEIYAERDVPFVIGTDSHAPDQLERRVELLEELLPELPVEITALPPGVHPPDR